MASKRRNMFYQNKKQETTERGTCNLLSSELSEKLRPSGLLVVVFIAGATTPAGVASRYDLANMAPAVDYMNLVVSEFHGFWDKVTGISSPLYSEDKKNIVDIVSYALRAGVPAGKILMRFSTYGQTFVMKFEPTDNVYLNVSAPETFKGPWSNQDGFMGFNEASTIWGSVIADDDI
ncbi:hypothetical protein AAG570_000835 [Ranatra chinensis]|uniref:GH18 domain-containing protein n=1 Tax=Ranatra chinensis TaxID=642074 RepID=A0ABD0Z8M7_9HEMI